MAYQITQIPVTLNGLKKLKVTFVVTVTTDSDRARRPVPMQQQRFLFLPAIVTSANYCPIFGILSSADSEENLNRPISRRYRAHDTVHSLPREILMLEN